MIWQTAIHFHGFNVPDLSVKAEHPFNPEERIPIALDIKPEVYLPEDKKEFFKIK
jgi:hypothetical protein